MLHLVGKARTEDPAVTVVARRMKPGPRKAEWAAWLELLNVIYCLKPIACSGWVFIVGKKLYF